MNKNNGIIIATLKKCCFRCNTESNKYYNFTQYVKIYIKRFAKKADKISSFKFDL